MSDEPIKEAAKGSLTVLQAAIKFLSVLEMLLPAFLVAWGNYLRNKNNALKGKLELSKIQNKTLERALNEKKDSHLTVIGRLLTKKLRGPKP